MPGSPYGADPQSYMHDLHTLGVGDWDFVDKHTRGGSTPTVKQLTGPHTGTPIDYSPYPYLTPVDGDPFAPQ